MFGLGFGEILLILVLALLVLGPEKLPKIARQLGKTVQEFRRAATEFQSSFSDMEQEFKEIQNPLTQVKEKLKTGIKSPTSNNEAGVEQNLTPSRTKAPNSSDHSNPAFVDGPIKQSSPPSTSRTNGTSSIEP